jgi:hypothetical protein
LQTSQVSNAISLGRFNIPYNLILTTKFNDSSILIMIISCDYLNLSLADEYVGDVTIPTQVIEYNHIIAREKKSIFWWDDDDVHSQKQQSTSRHVL